MQPGRILIVTLLAFGLITCNQQHGGDLNVGEHIPIGLVALDLQELGQQLASDRRLPVQLEIHVDGHPVGQLVLPAPSGILSGHATIPFNANEAGQLMLTISTPDGTVLRTEMLELEVAGNEVLRVPVRLTPAGRIDFGEPRRFELPSEINLAIYFRDLLRESVVLADLPSVPARAIVSVLRDPQIDSVIPFTPRPSNTDEVGPLVGVSEPAQEVVVPGASDNESPATSAVAVTAVHHQLVDGVQAPLAMTEAPKVLVPPVPTAVTDYLYYYSYCSCGKPAPERSYTMTTVDGRVFEGMTDRFGMVLLRGVTGGTINFGRGQQNRTRSYAYVPGQPETHASMLAAVGSSIPNEQLTALLDLRREPLEDARSVLIALLGHEQKVAWLNAAVTLSYYPGTESLVNEWLSALEIAIDEGDRAKAARAVTILGSMRHPGAVSALSGILSPNSAALGQTAELTERRALAAWALGFIAAPSGIKALEAALESAPSSIKDEILLALDRIEAAPYTFTSR